MGITDVPLAVGQTEAVDPRYPPAVTVLNSENCIIDKDNRLAKRRGFAVDGSFSAFTCSIYSRIKSLGAERLLMPSRQAGKHEFYMLSRTNATSTDGDWNYTFALPHMSSTLEVSEFTSAVNTAHSGCVYLSGYLAVCYENLTTSEVVVHILDATTRNILLVEITSNAEQPKLVTVGNYIVLCYRDTSNNYVVGRSFDTSATTIPTTMTSNGQLGSSALSSGQTYDIAPLNSTNFCYVEWNGATRVARTYTFDGTVNDSDSTADTNTIRPMIYGINDGTDDFILVAWQDATSDDAFYEWFDTSLTSVVGPVNLSVSNVLTPPYVGLRTSSSSKGIVVVATGTASNPLTRGFIADSSGSTTTDFSIYGRLPASKPFFDAHGSTSGVMLFMSDEGDIDRCYSLFSGHSGTLTAARVDAAFARGVAIATTDQANNLSVPANTGTGTWAWAAQFVSRGDVTAATPTMGTELVDLDVLSPHAFGDVELDGLLYMSGACMSAHDSTYWCEPGFTAPPLIHSATAQGSGGSMADGTYSYVVTYEATMNGRVFRSAPSLAVSATTSAGGTDSVTVTFRRHAATQRPGANFAGYDVLAIVKAHVWRTTDGGSIYYRVTDDDGVAADVSSGTSTASHTDTLADASITANAVVYTQVGNQLANASPPACTHLIRHGDRLVALRLENPHRWQASKSQTPGEGVHWADDDAFRGQLPEKINGGFSLDGRLVMGSTGALYEVNGDGPDDTGQGSFLPPRQLPSDVGIHDQRSVLELPDGVAFQASATQMYLLPRGGGAPVYFGEAVKDTLSSYPVITSCQLLKSQNLAVWTCVDDNDAPTGGKLIVYDTRVKVWGVWDVCSTRSFRDSAEWSGELALIEGTASHGGEPLIQTDGLYSDTNNAASETFITQTVELTDFRPFGANGWGRIPRFMTLAEYRADCILSAQTSHDSGQSYATAVTFNLIAAGGLTAGDTVQRLFVPATWKTDHVRVKLQTTQYSSTVDTEGAVFHAITFEHEKAKGVRRLPSAQVS